ncbi:Ribosomal RNA small subunit methyltransferase H [Hartmannibacter diazotrophicus]|uniref:Ribosomal RNA small subunit methyltransferase H n=1 Tax=Hartmannibacter diazotrophicus TaxID=1482074 RepID=A0A2C9DA97_9HYPH|nr:16S rRNA (cytosine(1402)-N(4))-methyltransferase RsmH [Hartmannibacter diazotrophicus]SON56525.1 Ribosomal RNA small subunit methyltransferase H [Hartmannibacter diazotrophicus]
MTDPVLATASDERHVPVLLDEVLGALQPLDGASVIDGTFGAGGYTRAILAAGAGRVIAIDQDPTAIANGADLVASSSGRLDLVHGRFADMEAHAEQCGLASVDGIVLDIGVSSMQLDQADRGFSFRFDGPLDMRMSREGPSAADVVNQLDGRDLARVISVLGEERRAGQIARAIVRRRDNAPLERTADLVSVIESVLGQKRFGESHPATRTFQAIRIYVNRELDELGLALAAAERLLAEGGRLAIVSFHSLEDRIVKRFLQERSRTSAQGSRHMADVAVAPPTFEMRKRSGIEPSEVEVARNPRARSARLRFAVRTPAPARALDLADLGVPQLPELPMAASARKA